jgi:protein TonB
MMEDSSNPVIRFFRKNLKLIVILSITGLVHIVVIFFIRFDQILPQKKEKDLSVFKMVDIQEYVPQEKKEDVVEIAKQDKIAEDVIETDKTIKEVEIDYLPQHQISELPQFPEKEIESRIIYPPLADKQGIEGLVILEIYIDQNGNVKKVLVLKDPGYGFGDAAKRAYEGMRCTPAKANGIPVAVKFRKPVRFTIRK